ncbi:CTP synthase [Traorella massiliensis]|uniref:CTP synthase n=1 Tax=Traorella massiliensis TaxID=1903263 RepID=UPI0008F8082D|nr:CTP synthase [Traorella massiliensis]
MRKYIFITGGVVSGLGKGITGASLGRLLKSRGYKVISQKLDPYINVDPGTMSPYQHGEVFVTEDGAETDLDLGHYERFIDENLNHFSNLTTGMVYHKVLSAERRGEYLGETVQVVPHITNEIKKYVYQVGEKSEADIVISEIGGTVGDIESQPFLESARQLSLEVGRENCCFIHVTLVPYISGSNEYKSKPTQHSVRELQSYGIHPNIIVTRSEGHLGSGVRKKISLFCNVLPECVIENETCKSLYEVVLMLEKQHFSEVVCTQLSLPPKPIDLSEWRSLVERINDCKREVTIGLVGKYVQLHDAYLSVMESLYHGGYTHGSKVVIQWIDSEEITPYNVEEKLAGCDGLIIPGGFGSRGIEGMIEAAHYARIHHLPLLGICLGMQVMTIEYARHQLHYQDANSYEFDPLSKHCVIHFMEHQSDEISKGGTMRLGAYPCQIAPDTKMRMLYDKEVIHERHRHRYEFNNDYREEMEKEGLVIAGTSLDGKLVEAIEVKDHDFYIGVQFHPEFKSRPNRPHPLFVGLIHAAIIHSQK